MEELSLSIVIEDDEIEFSEPTPGQAGFHSIASDLPAHGPCLRPPMLSVPGQLALPVEPVRDEQLAVTPTGRQRQVFTPEYSQPDENALTPDYTTGFLQDQLK